MNKIPIENEITFNKNKYHVLSVYVFAPRGAFYVGVMSIYHSSLILSMIFLNA